MASVERRRITRYRDGALDDGPDQVAIEEPLEIEVDGTVVSTTILPRHAGAISASVGSCELNGTVTMTIVAAAAASALPSPCTGRPTSA